MTGIKIGLLGYLSDSPEIFRRTLKKASFDELVFLCLFLIKHTLKLLR